jgi:hypothetical protein
VVLSVIATGCYRWLASRLKGYETATARTLWETFLDRPGQIRLSEKELVVRVRRFSRAPVLLEAESQGKRTPLPWLGGRSVLLEVS